MFCLYLILNSNQLLVFVLSLAYMAPGLCYLGVNGGEFLVFANSLLNRSRRKESNDVSEDDLPVEGRANEILSTEDSIEIDSDLKPMWWYIAGFPIWCQIASIGNENMRKKIREEGEVTSSGEDVSEDDFLIPNGREFFIAIFFVVFGFVSVIAGVASNFYAQIAQ